MLLQIFTAAGLPVLNVLIVLPSSNASALAIQAELMTIYQSTQVLNRATSHSSHLSPPRVSEKKLASSDASAVVETRNSGLSSTSQESLIGTETNSEFGSSYSLTVHTELDNTADKRSGAASSSSTTNFSSKSKFSTADTGAFSSQVKVVVSVDLSGSSFSTPDTLTSAAQNTVSASVSSGGLAALLTSSGSPSLRTITSVTSTSVVLVAVHSPPSAPPTAAPVNSTPQLRPSGEVSTIVVVIVAVLGVSLLAAGGGGYVYYTHSGTTASSCTVQARPVPVELSGAFYYLAEQNFLCESQIFCLMPSVVYIINLNFD